MRRYRKSHAEAGLGSGLPRIGAAGMSHSETVIIDSHEVTVTQLDGKVYGRCECGQGAVRHTLVEVEENIRALHDVMKQFGPKEPKTEMLPEAVDVLAELRRGRSPEDLIDECFDTILVIWSDTLENVHSEEVRQQMADRQKVLAALYGLDWYGKQSERQKKKINENGNVFMKKRAPAGWEQWEFELLQKEEDKA